MGQTLISPWSRAAALAAAVALQVAGLVLLPSLGPATIWVRCGLTIGAAVTLAHLGVSVTKRLYPPEKRFSKDHDMLSGSFATVGAVYSLVLGFVVVVVWQQYSDTENTIAREANAIADLERMSRGFPVEVQRQVQDASRTYLRLVINEEWPSMARGESSERAHAALVELWGVYTDMQGKERDNPLYDKSLERLNQLGDNRRLRLNASTQTVPPLMWVLLYAGAGVTLVMLYLFWTSSEVIHRIAVTFLVGVLTFVLFLTAALEQPFDSNLPIEPQSFEQVLENMRQLET